MVAAKEEEMVVVVMVGIQKNYNQHSWTKTIYIATWISGLAYPANNSCYHQTAPNLNTLVAHL